jgi:hypothetical protein
LVVLLGFGIHLSDLAFLVAFRVVTLVSRDGDDAFDLGALELAVGAALPVELKACFPEGRRGGPRSFWACWVLVEGGPG